MILIQTEVPAMFNMAHVAAAAGEFQDDILGVGTTQKPNMALFQPIMICYQPISHLNIIRHYCARG